MPAPDVAPSSSSSSGGIGGALKQKFGPLPVWLWLVIITGLALAYYLWSSSKKKKAAAAASSTRGQDTMSGQPGVVVVNEDTGGQTGGGGPGHKKHHKGGGGTPPAEPGQRDIRVSKDETLGQLAASRHWSQRTLGNVERENVTQGGGEWNPNTELTTGEEVMRPYGS